MILIAAVLIPTLRVAAEGEAEIRDFIGLDSLIEAIPASVPAMEKYLNLRKRALGLETLDVYDLYTPMVENLNAICRGEQTPQGMADAINALWEAKLAEYSPQSQPGRQSLPC